ncbi:MAG: hypothetical protein RIG62_04220 [Cyclobacteriaceae bacterium]
MKRRFLSLCMMGALMLASVPGMAQDAQLPLTEVVATPQFFISILAGVLLAIGFQVLLTSLSVAIGFSAIGDVEKQSHDSDPDNHASHDLSDSTPIGVKISSGVGLFTLITSSIALFCACLLAVKLSLVGNVVTGITLGLVIWATFFTALAYLEGKAVSTLLGSLIGMVTSGLRTAGSAIQSMLTPSATHKMEDVADHAIEKISKEMQHNLDLHPLKEKVDEYVDRMEKTANSGPNYEQVKQDLVNLLKDLRIEEKSEVEMGGEKDTEIFIKLASEQPNLTKEDVNKLKNTYQQARKAVNEGNTNEEKAKKVAAQFTSASEEDIDGYIQQIESYLRDTERAEINPDAIREDIEQIVNDPKHAQAILKERISQMDRGTLVALLEQHQKMDHQKAEKIVSYVEEAIDWVSKKTDYVKGATQKEKKANSQASDIRVEADGTMSQSSNKFEGRMRQYLSGLNRPELQYDSLKHDVERILHDPKSSPRIIRSRLSQFDKETFMALLTSNDRISRRDVENIGNKVDETRQQLLMKVEELEKGAQRKAEQAKQMALHQAENARKTAATAAWWLFATALVSGLASAAGGLLAI